MAAAVKKKAAAARSPSSAVQRRAAYGAGPLWITHDSATDGRLLPFVGVWRARPDRVACGRGHIWRRGDGGLDGYAESLWPHECTAMFGVAPDDDIQCIRVGR